MKFSELCHYLLDEGRVPGEYFTATDEGQLPATTHPTTRTAYVIILKNPGIWLSEIARKMNMPPQQVRHHLAKLKLLNVVTTTNVHPEQPLPSSAQPSAKSVAATRPQIDDTTKAILDKLSPEDRASLMARLGIKEPEARVQSKPEVASPVPSIDGIKMAPVSASVDQSAPVAQPAPRVQSTAGLVTQKKIKKGDIISQDEIRIMDAIEDAIYDNPSGASTKDILDTVRSKYYADNPDVYEKMHDNIKKQVKDMISIMLNKGTVLINTRIKKDGLPVYTKGEDKEIVNRNTGELTTLEAGELDNGIGNDDLESIAQSIHDRAMKRDYNDTGIDFG